MVRNIDGYWQLITSTNDVIHTIYVLYITLIGIHARVDEKYSLFEINHKYQMKVFKI